MKLRRISLAVLSVLLSVTAALSGFMVYTQLSGRQKEKEGFAELAELVQTVPSELSLPDEMPSIDNKPESEQKRDLTPLFAQNSDCIGWLSIPGTAVNYPVMHTPENPQKYLRRSFYGEYSQSGVPFLDRRCGLDSDNLIIYGHNMKNGTMFSSLRNYTDPAFCAAHPVIEFQTADGAEQYAVFAVAAVQKTDDWYGFIHAADGADFSEQTAAILQKSLYDTGITPVYGRQIITLSTCSYEFTEARFVVAAVKL